MRRWTTLLRKLAAQKINNDKKASPHAQRLCTPLTLLSLYRMATLTSMFPSLSPDLCHITLEKCNGRLEETIEALLAVGDNDAPVARATQRLPDEFLR